MFKLANEKISSLFSFQVIKYKKKSLYFLLLSTGSNISLKWQSMDDTNSQPEGLSQPLTFFWRTLIFLSFTSNISFMSRISPANVPFSSVRSWSCFVFLLRKDSFSSSRNLSASTWNREKEKKWWFYTEVISYPQSCPEEGWGSSMLPELSVIKPLLRGTSMPCTLTAYMYLKVLLCVYLNSDTLFYYRFIWNNTI